MAFQLDIGGGYAATVTEPSRTQFAANLGGAVEFSLAHVTYKILETMGGALGSFIAGLLIQFLARIEPELVYYTAPLIDMILEAPSLDPHIREFLNAIRNPKHEGAAALLSGLAGNAGGNVVNSALGVALWPLTAWLNGKFYPARPGPAEAWAMYRLGFVNELTMKDWLKDQGYSPTLVEAYGKLTKQRLDTDSLLELVLRGEKGMLEVNPELNSRGLDDKTIGELRTLQHKWLAPLDIIALFLRHEINQDRRDKLLKGYGFQDEDILEMMKLARPIPQIQDLVRMAVREAFSEDVVRKFGYDDAFPASFASWAEQQGLTTEWALRFWRAHWELPSVQLGFEMLHRKVIDKGTLETLLRTADYPPYWVPKLIDVSYSPLTRVDVRRMYGMKVLTAEQVKKAYMDLGYDETNAEYLKQFTIRYEDEANQNKKAKYAELTQSLVVRALMKGVIDRPTAAAHLAAIDYTPEDVEFILNLADAEKALEVKPDYQTEYMKDAILLVETSYSKQLIDRQTANSMLTQVGVSPAEIEYRLTTVEHAEEGKDKERKLQIIGDAYKVRALDLPDTVTLIGKLNIPAGQQEHVLNEWDDEREIRSRRLTEAQYRAAYQLGIILDDDYIEACRGLGYTEKDIALLVAMAKTKAEQAAESQPKPRALSIDQYVTALAAGTLSETEFYNQLHSLGYSDADVKILVETAQGIKTKGV